MFSKKPHEKQDSVDQGQRSRGDSQGSSDESNLSIQHGDSEESSAEKESSDRTSDSALNKSKDSNTPTPQEEAEKTKLRSSSLGNPPPSVVEPSSSSKKPPSAPVMYGDLINAICFTAFLPMYIYQWQTDFPNEVGPRNICIAFFFTVSFAWPSWYYNNTFCSGVAMVFMSLAIAGMNIYGWPHPDELIVIPQFIWCLLIVVSNMPLTLRARLGFSAIAFCNAIIVLSVLDALENLPQVFAAQVVFVLFHYQAYGSAVDGGSEGFHVSANHASIMLAGSFAYYVSLEMLSMYRDNSYATTGGFNILRIGFFSAAGLAASGTFKQETKFKEALEKEVARNVQSIRAQAERLRTVEKALQMSETAMAVTSVEDFLIFWSNDAFERLTGYKFDGSLRRKPETLWSALKLNEADRLKVDQHRLGIMNKDSVTTISVAGRDVEVEIDTEESSDQVLVVLKDVTEKRARQEAEREVEKQAMISKTMNESMQTLSHELRTPLQGIMGMTSLILGDSDLELQSEVKECLSIVMTSSRLLLTLINNMLDSRKCDAGKLDQFKLVSISLMNAVDEAKIFCQPFASISGLSIEMDDFDSSVFVMADALRLQQIMINLLSNAIKYSPTNSKVTVSVRVVDRVVADRELREHALAKDGYIPESDEEKAQVRNNDSIAIVSVRDQGNGIIESQASRVFARFGQLDSKPITAIGGNTSSAGQSSGTGLGLSLCANFVSRLKGMIWVQNNTASPGCTFSFFLPVHNEEEKIRKEARSFYRQKQYSGSGIDLSSRMDAIRKLRVLVVDDILINLKILCRMIKRVGVGKVELANSGKEALEALDKMEFDLVITDLHMPEMSGRELSEIIRESTYSNRPTIFGLTAEENDAVDALCIESGMSLVLHKPVTQGGLEAFFFSVTNSKEENT